MESSAKAKDWITANIGDLLKCFGVVDHHQSVPSERRPDNAPNTTADTRTFAEERQWHTLKATHKDAREKLKPLLNAFKDQDKLNQFPQTLGEALTNFQA